jgi:hypothetical protein
VVNDHSIFLFIPEPILSTLGKRETYVFIVRVWAEYIDVIPSHWRGVVVNCSTEDETPFANLKELVDVIRQGSMDQFNIKKEL